MLAPLTGPKIDYVREELVAKAPKYQVVRDCVEGQIKIKSLKQAYLPQPNVEDASQENLKRYEAYLLRAVFYAVTGHTLAGLVGQVFKKTPKAEIPETLRFLAEDIDGGGTKLDQQTKKALGYVLQFGRAGLFVDYPTVKGAASKADQIAGKVRPNIMLYDPADVINWRTVYRDGKTLLALVVIRELATVSDDGFEAKQETRFRVLKLTPEGRYLIQIWKKESRDGGIFVQEGADVYPTKGDGTPWLEIPFGFIGSENNDADPDEPPLYDLASLNVAHYRNSADYEEAVYMLGQPTPYVTGVGEDWVNDVLKGKIYFGSRAILPLPKDATAGLLQTEPNGMAKEAMDQKEVQMVALGAKLVEQRKTEQTATEAGQNESTQLSVLGSCANNVSAAYTRALKWACDFSNLPSDNVSYALSVEFDKAFATSADWSAIVSLWQSTAIAGEEMRSALAKAGLATMKFEDWKDAIETAGPGLGSPVEEQKIAAAEAEAKMRADAAKQKAANRSAV